MGIRQKGGLTYKHRFLNTQMLPILGICVSVGGGLQVANHMDYNDPQRLTGCQLVIIIIMNTQLLMLSHLLVQDL